jgi:hypothetical protein
MERSSVAAKDTYRRRLRHVSTCVKDRNRFSSCQSRRTGVQYTRTAKSDEAPGSTKAVPRNRTISVGAPVTGNTDAQSCSAETSQEWRALGDIFVAGL